MELVKALLVGICAAAPVGPVLLMVFQKSVLFGHRCGWVTGLGGTVCDTTWAAVSLFAISLVHAYVQDHLAPFQILGGLLIFGIGLSIAVRKPLTRSASSETLVGGKPVQYMMEAMGCAFGNPGALAFMLVLVGLFGLSSSTLTAPVWLVVLCVALGSAAYWWLLSLLLSRFGSRLSPRTQAWISRLSGCGMAVFGLVFVIRGITML